VGSLIHPIEIIRNVDMVILIEYIDLSFGYGRLSQNHPPPVPDTYPKRLVLDLMDNTEA